MKKKNRNATATTTTTTTTVTTTTTKKNITNDSTLRRQTHNGSHVCAVSPLACAHHHLQLEVEIYSALFLLSG